MEVLSFHYGLKIGLDENKSHKMSESDCEVEISNQNIANLIKQRRKPKPTWREVKEQFLRENGNFFIFMRMIKKFRQIKTGLCKRRFYTLCLSDWTAKTWTQKLTLLAPYFIQSSNKGFLFDWRSFFSDKFDYANLTSTAIVFHWVDYTVAYFTKLRIVYK